MDQKVIVDTILKTLFKWETTRYDYPFSIAVNPRILFILCAEVPHMMEIYLKEQRYKFRGIPVIVSHDYNSNDYFEFMDEKMVSERAKAIPPLH